ncbi:4-(cytidine 5'-diphospho)-2-C-methyl-D-erythritol kinase [Methylococcus sp. EFPC2]|uniref:4-(cytidine 5'-diphospho)-2-C-methyl-D-erythritol kinase n=1 Tax=Methylococcus sp. EFPC2 TaxID=2812648 RepID=UPI001F0810A3|nr:4-(cytidine 5'-diphospho)-2-C-methyl-D-erythritol kinase [Methylococcus sp. EFPC2]
MSISTELRLPASAKLNLTLRIVGRRPDGYHLLQTVFQFVDLCDWITYRVRGDDVITLLNPLPGVPEESDLTVRAARILRREVGSTPGVEISIEKNLPMGGGLGGGSSDAATTLLALNALWGLNLSIDRLAELGLELGADVPVFVRGIAAWAEGVGEKIVPLPDLAEPWYVILNPPCHVATGAVFNAPGLTRDHHPITIRDFLAGQQENHCLSVVTELYPPVRDALAALGAHAGEARLTGTGACVFAAYASKEEAESAAEALAQDWKVFVTRGVNVSPAHSALELAKQ